MADLTGENFELVEASDGGIIDLAREEPRTVGPLTLIPAHREVIGCGGAIVIEPRVMQVLLVLSEAQGRVVGIDELIARCWSGRIVNENAIHRVISKIRRLSEKEAAGALQVENVAKVGYRLVEAGAPPSIGVLPSDFVRPARQPWIDRRLLIGGGLTLATGLLLPWINRQITKANGPDPLAAEYYRRGQAAQWQGLGEQNAQASAFFRQAVEQDPDFADGWGALALAYRHQLEGDPGDDQEKLAALTRSAAARALELDPANSQAQLALAIIAPYFGHWQEIEAKAEVIARRDSKLWLARGTIARIHAETGRFARAIEGFRAIASEDSFLPVTQYQLALALWGAGRMQETEIVVDQASRRWPQHPRIWMLKFDYLMQNGRGADAIAMLQNRDAMPQSLSEESRHDLMSLAEAFAEPRPDYVDRARALLLNGNSRRQGAIPRDAGWLAALGIMEPLFPLIEAHLLAKPCALVPEPRPIGTLTRRDTRYLFMPAMQELRAQPQFADLTKAIGLDAYWQATGSKPDYLA